MTLNNTVAARQFNPVSLMIIFFLFSLTLLKIDNFNPFEMSLDHVWQKLLFWIIIIGEMALGISLICGKFREKIAKMTSTFVMLYMSAYTTNWLYSFSNPNVFSDSIIASYVLFGGLFMFLLLTFFSIIRSVEIYGNKICQKFVAFVLVLICSFVLFIIGNCIGGYVVLLLSMSLLAFALGWNPPDYFPV